MRFVITNITDDNRTEILNTIAPYAERIRNHFETPNFLMGKCVRLYFSVTDQTFCLINTKNITPAEIKARAAMHNAKIIEAESISRLFPTEEECRNELVGFPVEILHKLVLNQVLQGNEPNIKVLDKNHALDAENGGFDWDETVEGGDFWDEVLMYKNFKKFFEMYPKKEEKVAEEPEKLEEAAFVPRKKRKKKEEIEIKEGEFADEGIKPVTPEDLIGEIKGFPIEVVERMLECQVEQGNKRDLEVFQKYSSADKRGKGFSWDHTLERITFWTKVIRQQKFDVFFEKYPKEEKELPKPEAVLEKVIEIIGKGDVEDFPTEVLLHLLDMQEAQGNPRKLEVFEKDRYAGKQSGGFDWETTPQGHIFYAKVLGEEKWEVFYEKFPKKAEIQDLQKEEEGDYYFSHIKVPEELIGLMPYSLLQVAIFYNEKVELPELKIKCISIMNAFSWKDTKEKSDFWSEVFNYPAHFYSKYPKCEAIDAESPIYPDKAFIAYRKPDWAELVLGYYDAVNLQAFDISGERASGVEITMRNSVRIQEERPLKHILPMYKGMKDLLED